MRPPRRHPKVAEQQALRAERARAAGQLLARIPSLSSLSLIVREFREDGYSGETVYTRRFQLEHAPALFEIPCTHDRCDGGYYDVTREVLMALEEGNERFEGKSTCLGEHAGAGCPRMLHYKATAAYQPARAGSEPLAPLRATK